MASVKKAGTLVTLDFEIYYDQKYTLKSKDLSTSEYVRDPRFEALCVGIKVNDGPTKVHWGDKAIRAALGKINWKTATLLCHHTHFDGLILSHHYKIVPARYACTLSMARQQHGTVDSLDLNEVALRYGKGNKLPDVLAKLKGKHVADLTPELIEEGTAYCATDVDLTYEIYQEMVKVHPPRELDVIDMLVRMFADPVLVLDMPRAKAELERERKEREALIAASGMPIDQITKNKPFADKLKALGVEPPMKRSPTTGKDIYAFAQTDLEFTALQRHPNQAVVALVKGRLAAKSTLAGTRIARLIRSGSKRQRLPVYIRVSGAHTHRGSGGDKLNYQNMPRAEFDELGNYLPPSAEIRRSIKAPPGYVICVVDSAQIQARGTAWMAGEDWLLEAFRNKRDPYCEFASIAYGRTITKADKLERLVGKICVLALGFGMGAERLQTTLAQGTMGPPVFLDLSICYRLVTTYRRQNAKIAAFWRFCNDRIIGDMICGREGEHLCFKWGKEYIEGPSGLRLHYPGLKGTIVPPNPLFKGSFEQVKDASYLTRKGRSKLYGGLLTENLAQFLEREVVYYQALDISERYRMCLQSHDENPYLAKVKEADEALAFGIKIMSTPPVWAPDLPVAAEGGYDVCYSK